MVRLLDLRRIVASQPHRANELMEGTLKLKILAAIAALSNTTHQDFHHIKNGLSPEHILSELPLFLGLDLVGRFADGRSEVFLNVVCAGGYGTESARAQILRP
jgi:hypothetical protein